jgi:magnesium transporter
MAIQRFIEHHDLTWIDLTYPAREQVVYLQERFEFHELHLEDVISRTQRPKIEDSDDPEYLFIVLHFPVFNEMTRLSVLSEIDIFIGHDFVVTAHNGKIRPLIRLAQMAESTEKVRDQLMMRGSGFLVYRIIETLVNACFPMLAKLDLKVDQLEELIFEQDVRKTVEEISFLRRDVMSLRRIIRPNVPVLRSLAARERAFLRLEEEESFYFGDLVDGLSRIYDMLEEQKETIDGLDATLASLTSHRINREMKLFTLISIIFLPMTLIASILGMNVVLPFSEEPFALPAILILMIGVGVGMIAFFRRKGWI